jgi:hypothetical protein
VLRLQTASINLNSSHKGTTAVHAKRKSVSLRSSSLLQSLEDLSTMYDGTVRNSSGGIVQLTYGDDGMDPVCMEAKDGQPVDFPRILMKTKVRILFINIMFGISVLRHVQSASDASSALFLSKTCPLFGEKRSSPDFFPDTPKCSRLSFRTPM